MFTFFHNCQLSMTALIFLYGCADGTCQIKDDNESRKSCRAIPSPTHNDCFLKRKCTFFTNFAMYQERLARQILFAVPTLKRARDPLRTKWQYYILVLLRLVLLLSQQEYKTLLQTNCLQGETGYENE